MDMSDEGPTLDRRWIEVGNNVCGVLHGCRDASTVATRFVEAGWNSSSSSWHGYELETRWCRLEIDPIDGADILLNGVVDPARLDELARLLGCFGLPYELELSDENDTVTREIRAEPAPAPRAPHPRRSRWWRRPQTSDPNRSADTRS
ncbi:hypothetical protein [Streptomyces sp. NPDC012508]|uniref:hypothetical protein n=1 Tax=Streptomyces sp. NPDC012508 TaxID=3364837 RepID=UPI0036D10132